MTLLIFKRRNCMNLLEHYIKEVHKVELKSGPSIFNDNIIQWYEVDLTYNCYGCIKRTTMSFPKKQWEEAKQKGYFLA